MDIDNFPVKQFYLSFIQSKTFIKSWTKTSYTSCFNLPNTAVIFSVFTTHFWLDFLNLQIPGNEIFIT